MPGLRFKLWPVFRSASSRGCRCPPARSASSSPRSARRCRSARRAPRYQPEFGNFSDVADVPRRRRREGRAAPGAPSRHARADPPGRVHGDHRPRGLRPAGVARAARSTASAARRLLTPGAFGLDPEPAAGRGDRPAGRHRHGRHRLRARGRTAPRRATSPAASAASRTSRAMEAGRQVRRRDDRGAARQQERAAQQLPGLPGVPRRRRPHRPAARPAAVRRLPAEPVPGPCRARADARS